MIPSLRLVWLSTAAVPLALTGLLSPVALWLAVLYDVALAVAVVIDRRAAVDPSSLALRRVLPPSGIQGKTARIELHVTSSARRPARVILRDLLPRGLVAEDTRMRLFIPPRGHAVSSYEALAAERGLVTFDTVTVRTSGPLGLTLRQRVVSLRNVVRVYPDLVALSAREAALVAPSAWQRGHRRGRLAGEGREFHQLRAYAPGDDARLMDWKAYARHGRPVVREHRAERNQRVLLALDAGRLMTIRVGDRARFDWAVQAAGRLARVALGAGDLVGITVFSREVKASLAPARGPGHLGQLSDLLSEVDADLDESNLTQALGKLLGRATRRTLVVLFSEIADPRAAEAAVRAVASLSPRHLVLVVTLADADLDEERHLPVLDADAVWRRTAAEELWVEYRRTVRALEQRGARVVRASAGALAAEAVERYVEIKREGRL